MSIDLCQVAKENPQYRKAQGYPGITTEKCVSMGFCFDDSVTNAPWCFSKTDPTKSVVLDLESLGKKYDTLLTQYNQAQTDYLAFISSSSEQTFVAKKGLTFWGTTPLQTVNTVATVDDCKALCASTQGCSGATFNASAHGQPFCWLRSGEGTLAGGLNGEDNVADFAILPKEKEMLQNLEMLNAELSNVNTQILNSIEQGNPLYTVQDEKRISQSQMLQQNYEKLSQEREKIMKKIVEYETINEKENNDSIKTTSFYYSFLFFLFLLILFIFFLIKIPFT